MNDKEYGVELDILLDDYFKERYGVAIHSENYTLINTSWGPTLVVTFSEEDVKGPADKVEDFIHGGNSLGAGMLEEVSGEDYE
jgi:hypothetical protein